MPAVTCGEIHTFNEHLFIKETRPTLSTANRIYKNIFQGSLLPVPVSIAPPSTSVLDICFEEREMYVFPLLQGGTGGRGVIVEVGGEEYLGGGRGKE